MKKDNKDKSSKAKGKMAALKNLHKMASDAMGEGMKKVSVMAKDKKGLEKGLSTAKKLVEGEDC